MSIGSFPLMHAMQLLMMQFTINWAYGRKNQFGTIAAKFVRQQRHSVMQISSVAFRAKSFKSMIIYFKGKV